MNFKHTTDPTERNIDIAFLVALTLFVIALAVFVGPTSAILPAALAGYNLRRVVEHFTR